MTAQELIKASYRVLGKIGQGKTSSDYLMQNGLEALHILLRSTGLSDIYFVDVESFTLDGSSSYTIGSGGDFDTVRPTRILGGYTRGTGVDIPFKMIGENKYRNLGFKETAGGEVAYVWYNPTYGSTGLGTVYVYPPGGGTIVLHNLKPLAEPTGIASDVLFPHEYDQFIKWNLAIQLAPECGKEPTMTVHKLAKDGKDDMIRYHAALRHEPSQLFGLSIMFNRRGLYGSYKGQG